MSKVPVLLPLQQRAELFAHLAAMEQAGVPVGQALRTLHLGSNRQSAIARLQREVETGHSLAVAGRLSGLFSPLEVSLLQAAEQAGSPARLYQRLASQYAEQARQRKAMQSRLYLPGATLLLALLIQPLPALVGGSLSVAGYLWAVLQPLLWLALAVWGWTRLRRQGEQGLLATNLRVAGFCLRLPVLGVSLARRAVRDYFTSLGLLLEAGVALFEAMPLAVASLGNAALREDFVALQARVVAGQPLALALQNMDFPGQPQLRALVASGEASGTLPAVLLGFAQRQGEQQASFEEQLATWLPRLAYLLVAVWMAHGLISGAGIGPSVPADLR